MADPTLIGTYTKTLITTPFFVRQLYVQTGAAAANVAHGCPTTPDVVVVQSVGAIDNANEITIVSKDATNLNIDCEDDGNNYFYVYCFCFGQASGGQSTITTT